VIWIQSIVCSLLLIANFAWPSKQPAVAVALNLLLATACLWLLLANFHSDDVDLTSRGNDIALRNLITAGLFLIYLGASVVKLNGSSTALWQDLADQQPAKAGVIAGKPKDIRSDEWLVHTPWIWSQAKRIPAFPTTNRNVGNGVAPLLTNLPVRHWTMLFRPQMWGFFVFDLERAYAFNWNFRWFGLLLGGFLFFRIIAHGNNFLSLSGALLLLYSSYMQWFFSNPTNLPEMVSMLFFGLWALHTLLKSTSRWEIFGASVVLLTAVEQFVFCCYPRYQVPLAYLAVALVAGGFAGFRRRRESLPATNNYFRVACLIATLVLAATLLYRWHVEIAPTFAEIRESIYPGRVFSLGGDFPWFRFLAPFLEFSMTQTHYPVPLGNVCEASGFLFVAPLLFLGLVSDVWRSRVDPILMSVVVFIAGAIWFMLVGVPQWIAQNSGWSYVVSVRAILAVGVASIIGLVRHLSLASFQPWKSGRTYLFAGTIATTAFFFCLYLANRRLGDFATLPEVIAAAIFFGTVGFFVLRRIALVSCTLLIVPCFWSTALVNPVSRGVPALTRGSVVSWLSKVHNNDPDARWIVTGPLSNRSCCLAQLVKATGADVFGGTRYTPDYELVNVLDPEKRYVTVYNRWARVCFVASTETDPAFELIHANDYEITLPFRADIFERLGVKYVLVVDRPDLSALEGFERIGERHGCVLLRRAMP
jgi:hypothetical protein